MTNFNNNKVIIYINPSGKGTARSMVQKGMNSLTLQTVKVKSH